MSVLKREWPPLEARQSEGLCLRHKMSLVEPDEGFRCLVLGCHLGGAGETVLLTDAEQRSGSKPCAQGRIGFEVVSAEHHTKGAPYSGHLLVWLAVSAALTHDSIVAACCISALLKSHHPSNVGITVTKTKASLRI